MSTGASVVVCLIKLDMSFGTTRYHCNINAYNLLVFMKRKYWYWVDCLGTDIVMMLFSMILPAYEN